MSDLRKGYELSSDVEERLSKAVSEAQNASKTEYNKLKSQYDELQNSVTEYEKRNTDLAERNKSLVLENVMTREGFKQEDFKDVSSMRYSMYGDEKDDAKAISQIKEKFRNTYFPAVDESKTKNDLPINNGTTKPEEIKVNRFTKIKDLMR